MNAFVQWFTTKRRKYIYRVITAALVVAGSYGTISAEEVNVWTAFLGIALVTGMADANTEADSDHDG